MAVSVSSQPKKSGQCAYCGKKQPVTDDHIPPKNLFPKPRGSNLITVPCCEFCRKGWSENDEYFILRCRISLIQTTYGRLSALFKVFYATPLKQYLLTYRENIYDSLYLGK
jgi:hypothetical protein